MDYEVRVRGWQALHTKKTEIKAYLEGNGVNCTIENGRWEHDHPAREFLVVVLEIIVMDEKGEPDGQGKALVRLLLP